VHLHLNARLSAIIFRFWGIFWIDATSNSTVEQGYEEIAQNLKLEPDFKIINGWLSRSEDPWLLIFDNADDPSLDLSQYFPIGNRGAILITTRNPDCVVHATAGSMEFDRLSVEDAVELLIKTAAIEDLSSEDPRILANLIVETLGCLALAIVQAGAAIRQKLCTMGDYCDIYSRQRKRLLSHQPVQASSDYRFTVYTTWEVSIKMIENLSNETAENALELLRFFSVLHFDGISEEILRRAWENMNGENDSSPWKLGVLRKIDSEKWDPHLIREALTLLLSFSLISINGTDNRISMHPLVHVWVRDRAIESNHLDWKAAAYTLSVSIPLDKDLYDYNYGRNVLPHINSCLGIYWSETSMADDMETSVIDIFRDFALVHGNHGRWQECLKLDEQVVKMCQVKFGEEHCDTLLAIYNRNHAYLRCNLNQEAIERAEQLLNISKVILGDEDALTLATISQLSYLYHTFGRDQEALVMTEKALQIRIKIWGNESDGTCDFMLDLANIYRGLGRFQEAVALEEQTLNIRKRLLGDDHPDLIRSMQQLAVTYSGLGRTQEALKLEEQTLKARKKSLGDEHPHTLTSMNNLATTYFRLDRTQESLELEEQTLKARKKLLGDEHRDTLYSMCNLAVTYYRLGRIQEALELQEQTLKGRKKVLSDEHPNTLDSMYCLTLIYEKLGRIQEVLELEEQTLKGRKKVVGDEHPDTLVSMGNLAITYRKLDRKQEALTLIKDAIEISKRVLCDNHPETLRYMRILEFVKRTDQEELPNWLDNEQKDIRIRNTSSKYSKNAFGSRWNPTYWMKKYGRK
jgi:tetratricopeptide (TPR) repeat protein